MHNDLWNNWVNFYNMYDSIRMAQVYIEGFVQQRDNSNVLAMELHFSSTNPSIWSHIALPVWAQDKMDELILSIFMYIHLTSRI